MAKIVESVKKSFLHLVESVKSWGGSPPKDAKEDDAETNLKVESKVPVMEVRERGPTNAGKTKPPPPQNA